MEFHAQLSSRLQEQSGGGIRSQNQTLRREYSAVWATFITCVTSRALAFTAGITLLSQHGQFPFQTENAAAETTALLQHLLKCRLTPDEPYQPIFHNHNN